MSDRVELLDLSVLLAPIPGDDPAGTDLRLDVSPGSLYLKLKDARSAARAAERVAEAPPDKEGERLRDPIEFWRIILQAAPAALAQRAKDLEIACWFLEALVRHHGFAGCREGVDLVRGLSALFWDKMFPREDEDGLETKLAPLAGLFGEGAASPLVQALRRIPLTGGEEPFALWHYEAGLEVMRIEDEAKRQKRFEGGKIPPPAAFETAFREVAAPAVRALAQNLDGAIIALNSLCDDLVVRCGVAAPSVSGVREVLERILGLVRHLGGEKLVEVSPAAEAATAEEGGTVSDEGFQRRNGFASREDAFAALLDIAAFFRRTEPHSLIPMMLENTVRRGRMPLPELLADLIPDEMARKTLYIRGGITDADSR